MKENKDVYVVHDEDYCHVTRQKNLLISSYRRPKTRQYGSGYVSNNKIEQCALEYN